MFLENKFLTVSVICLGLFMIGFFLGCTFASNIASKKISALKKSMLTQKRNHDIVLAHYKKHHGQHPDCPNFPGYPVNYPNGYNSAPVEVADRPDRNNRNNRNSKHRG